MVGDREVPSSGEDPIARLLVRSSGGDRAAFDELFGLLYDELRILARRHVRAVSGDGVTLCTTALVHESYLKLSGGSEPRPRQRAQFFAVASKAMRHILVDYARRRRAVRRGGDMVRVRLTEESAVTEEQITEVLALDTALTRLGERDPRLERVVECRFFAGMNVADTAEALGVSGRTVERDWSRAKLYLHHLLSPAA